jgi:hypothetical protein
MAGTRQIILEEKLYYRNNNMAIFLATKRRKEEKIKSGDILTNIRLLPKPESSPRIPGIDLTAALQKNIWNSSFILKAVLHD